MLSLLLDNWRSLFNVGAAFRTGDGAGVAHLYLCGITATPANQPRLARTALGAEQSVGWSYHTDAVELAAQLRRAGTQVWVLERLPRSRSLFDINASEVGTSVVLVGGNEVLGVDPGLLALADQAVHLPMQGRKVSLNVAVALSVATYWLRAREVAATAVQKSEK
jgi:tRNA G18 (ribose-2'-O)-methylase SpoU